MLSISPLWKSSQNPHASMYGSIPGNGDFMVHLLPGVVRRCSSLPSATQGELAEGVAVAQPGEGGKEAAPARGIEAQVARAGLGGGGLVAPGRDDRGRVGPQGLRQVQTHFQPAEAFGPGNVE